jgi:ribonuclease D
MLQWVRTSEALSRLALRLRGAAAVALDTESDSLHHFPEKVCLLQVATPDGMVYLVDPLAVPDLTPLGAVCADAATIKVLHGATYDVASMKRDFGFRFSGLFDTMVAAQFLGIAEVGLAALLRRFLGVEPAESRQKDDWAVRPLTPAQERYAADDVRHLIGLRTHLADTLVACGRERWVEEECGVVEATPAARRVVQPEDCFRIKGTRALDRRGLAVLRELFVAREAWAQAGGRPPFKVLGNDTLIRVASARSTNRAGLAGIPGCTPVVLNRYGDGILEAIARANAIPEPALPVLPRRVKPRVAPIEAQRMSALAAWRAGAAARLGLDPGLLLPRRLIERLAEMAPRDPDTLATIDGIRRWRVAILGREILEVLAGCGSAPAATRVGRGGARLAGENAG